ncbi:MAG TPA: histidine kinase dimerization/phospho-acceptor domain-containing protein, partial [Sphingomicrobium sp.]|nr:histidine kinase dimerization/phospho-acceptor domain-containing protein [Sphingomicrobium sp.]
SAAGAASGPAAPSGAPALFRWECGPSGEIAWVEGAPRGALIGRSIARPRDETGARVDADVARAFSMRAPFRDSLLTVPGDGLVSGEWKISGIPAFDPTDGRFAGYRGIALRDLPPPAEPGTAPEFLADPDSLRELVHEIKTPLNAIIGFAEIIDGQYLGPADRRYRERASEIVTQAHLLLGAIDDLDFAAKIHSSTEPQARRTDLGEQLDTLSPSLRELASKRGVELEITRSPRMARCAVEPELADRLLYRLSVGLIEQAEAGERLRLAVEQNGHSCRFSISRPTALKGVADSILFDPRPSSEAEESGTLGTGFSLRLVRGLARIAGGDLVASPAGITLLLPIA